MSLEYDLNVHSHVSGATVGISKHHMCWTIQQQARYFPTAPSFSVNSFQLGKIKQVLEVATCHI